MVCLSWCRVQDSGLVMAKLVLDTAVVLVVVSAGGTVVGPETKNLIFESFVLEILVTVFEDLDCLILKLSPWSPGHLPRDFNFSLCI